MILFYNWKFWPTEKQKYLEKDSHPFEIHFHIRAIHFETGKRRKYYLFSPKKYLTTVESNDADFRKLKEAMQTTNFSCHLWVILATTF